MGADLLDPAATGGLSGGTGRRAPRAVAASPAGADEGEEALVGAVLSWWADARGARDRLPWRTTRDPWAVLVSETMLVQTQAPRVAARFPEVLDRFPTPAALADATTAEALACWTGLGYNRRALWLQRAARRVVEHHRGAVPDDLDDLMALPGVGPYTARAVLAFAFGRPVGVVDTNVGRVLARAVAGRRLSPAEAQSRADRLRRTRDALMPGGSFQERGLGIVHLLARQGPALVQEIAQAMDPWSPGHQVVGR